MCVCHCVHNDLVDHLYYHKINTLQVLTYGTPLLSSTVDEFQALENDPEYQKMTQQVHIHVHVRITQCTHLASYPGPLRRRRKGLVHTVCTCIIFLLKGPGYEASTHYAEGQPSRWHHPLGIPLHTHTHTYMHSCIHTHAHKTHTYSYSI